MRTHTLRLLLGLGLVVVALATVALTQPAAGADPQMHAGPAVAIGDGQAWAFVRTDADGTPEAIGLVITEAALDGLPTDVPMPGHEGMHMRTLPLPEAVPGLLIDHVSLDWNPAGHEPPGLFDVPHFDMHFYMVPEAERVTWLPDNAEFMAKAERFPEARYLPAGYMSPPGNLAIPLMGWHWFDGADPTYAPGGPAFTEVFIWGSYDGQIIFPEPMITRAYLQSHPDHTEDLAQPEAFQREGYYPTRYSVRYDPEARHVVIALEGLVHRPAG